MRRVAPSRRRYQRNRRIVRRRRVEGELPDTHALRVRNNAMCSIRREHVRSLLVRRSGRLHSRHGSPEASATLSHALMSETDARAPVSDRLSRGDIPFVICALVSGIFVLYLGRSLTFWYDEWRSITFDGGPLDFLRPVNEHWSTLPLLLYRATFNAVELHSYMPYLVQVIVLHLVAVAGAYVLMRGRVGRMTATLLALPLLLLGAGAENLYWAFQTGFVGSVAFGVWALVLVERDDRRGHVLASALLVASLMSSGIGLFFVAAVGARTLADRMYRACAVAAAPSAVAYLLWFAAFGHDAVGESREIAGPASVARFVFRSVGFATESMVGLHRAPTGRAVGVAIFLILCMIVVRQLVRGRRQGLAVGCLVGMTSMYTGIGVARAELEPDYTTRSRYVYIAAFFLVLCIADLLRHGASTRTSPSSRARLAALAAGGLLLAWVVVVNIGSLFTVRTQFQFQADVTRAIIQLAVEHEGEAWLDPDAGLDFIPPARDLPSLVERHGSPLEDDYFASVARVPTAAAFQAARRYLSRKVDKDPSKSGA